jgi:SAM-dependent methyltransferase
MRKDLTEAGTHFIIFNRKCSTRKFIIFMCDKQANVTSLIQPDAAADDWDAHWKSFSLASEMAPATKYRHQLCIKLLHLNKTGAGVRLLDIGSGTGGFAGLFCSRFPKAEFLGLELSQAGVELSRSRVPQARFERHDLMTVRPRTPDFQATHAICSEVLEHLDDPKILLQNAMSFMASGCRIVITVPGGKPNAFDKYIGHRRHYDATALQALLESAGLCVELSTGVGFPFFNLYRLLTTWRGERLKEDVSGSPSMLVRFGTLVFGTLFKLNLTSMGWQTVAVAYRL